MKSLALTPPTAKALLEGAPALRDALRAMVETRFLDVLEALDRARATLVSDP
jgi:hypothetical protein